MCRLDPEDFNDFEEECKKGYVDEELLDDTAVYECEGFKALMPTSKNRLAEGSWSTLLLAVTNALCHEPVESLDEATARDHWQVVHDGRIKAGHHLIMKKGERFSLFLAKHRKAWKELRQRFRTLDLEEEMPTPRDRIQNLMVAMEPTLRKAVETKLRDKGVGKDEVTWEALVRRAAREELRMAAPMWSQEIEGDTGQRAYDRGRSRYGSRNRSGSEGSRSPASTPPPPAPRAKPNLKRSVQFNMGAQGNKNPVGGAAGESLRRSRKLTPEQYGAIKVYAQAKGVSTSEVLWETVESEGGLAKWGSANKAGGQGEGKPKETRMFSILARAEKKKKGKGAHYHLMQALGAGPRTEGHCGRKGLIRVPRQRGLRLAGAYAQRSSRAQQFPRSV